MYELALHRFTRLLHAGNMTTQLKIKARERWGTFLFPDPSNFHGNMCECKHHSCRNRIHHAHVQEPISVPVIPLTVLLFPETRQNLPLISRL